MNVFLLAAGNNERWGFDRPKQLADVAGETVIARVVRQVRERGHSPVVVTHNALIGGAVDCEVMKPKRRRWTLETFLSTRDRWEEPMTAVLLGDVIFSKAVMDKMLSLLHGIRVFGATGTTEWRRMKNEFFGVVFDKASYGRVRKVLGDCIWRAETTGYAKLITMYQRLCGSGYDGRESFNVPERSMFQDVMDYTADMDTAQRYKAFVEHVVDGGMLDDLRS